jgi:hypothetical protein
MSAGLSAQVRYQRAVYEKRAAASRRRIACLTIVDALPCITRGVACLVPLKIRCAARAVPVARKICFDVVKAATRVFGG